MERTNEMRSADADAAVHHYRTRRAGQEEAYTDEPDDSMIPDLLTDLMHLANERGLDFAAMLAVAQESFEEESER